MPLQNTKDDSQTFGLEPFYCLKNYCELNLKKNYCEEFPGGLVVRILGSHCHGPGSVPDWRTEITQDVWHGPQK